MAKLTFTELGRISLTDERSIVISKVEETGNISIAHSITTQNENGETRNFFLNNSVILNEQALQEFVGILSQNTTNKTKKRKVTKNG